MANRHDVAAQQVFGVRMRPSTVAELNRRIEIPGRREINQRRIGNEVEGHAGMRGMKRGQAGQQPMGRKSRRACQIERSVVPLAARMTSCGASRATFRLS